MKNPLIRFFQFLADMITGAEKSIIDLLDAVVPYLVPVIPAYLTYYHVQVEMGFPEWVAKTAAFVVEVLGLAAVSTAIRFYYHNRRYKDEKNKVPYGLAIGVYAFYIFIVILVNVILEIVTKTRSGWVITAIALFSLLSVPSGVLIAIRAQFGYVLDDIDKKYHRNTNNGPLPQPGQIKRTNEKHAGDYRDRILQMLEDEYSRSKQVLTPKQITTRLKLTHANNKGFVSGLTKEWKIKKGIS